MAVNREVFGKLGCNLEHLAFESESWAPIAQPTLSALMGMAMQSSFQSLGFGKLVVSSIATVETSLSSEIPMRVSCVDCLQGEKNWPLWGVGMVEI